MQVIKFNDREFRRVFLGKLCTIRLGNKLHNYTLGEAKLDNVDAFGQCGDYRVNINSITFTKFSHITASMINGELAVDIEELLHRLRDIYNVEIKVDSFVTVIQFDMPFNANEPYEVKDYAHNQPDCGKMSK